MRRIVQCAIVAAAALLIAQTSVYAKQGGQRQGDRKAPGKECMMMHGDRMGPGGPMFGDPERMKKDLGLTDEQVKKIAGINNEHKKKMLEFKEKIAPREIQLERLLLEDAVDLAKVKSLLREISDLKVEIQMLRIQHRLDIEKVLTAEQKAKMRQHRKHMMGKKGHGPKGHGPEGPRNRD